MEKEIEKERVMNGLKQVCLISKSAEKQIKKVVDELGADKFFYEFSAAVQDYINSSHNGDDWGAFAYNLGGVEVSWKKEHALAMWEGINQQFDNEDEQISKEKEIVKEMEVNDFEHLTYDEKRLLMDATGNRMRRYCIFLSIMMKDSLQWGLEFGEIAAFDATVPTIDNIRQFSPLDILIFLERFSEKDYKTYDTPYESGMHRCVFGRDYKEVIVKEFAAAQEEYEKNMRIYNSMYIDFIDEINSKLKDDICRRIVKSDNPTEMKTLCDCLRNMKDGKECLYMGMTENGYDPCY